MVIKIIEVIGVSAKSFDDAVASAVERASKTVKHITGVDVIGQTASVRDGKIDEYRVDLKLAFKVEE